METINIIKDAATKVIWGEPEANKEPVSGRMGNTAAGEPYDAGNIESTSTALKTTNPNPEVEPVNTPLKTENNKTNTDRAVTNAEFNQNANPSATSVELPPPTPSEKPAASASASASTSKPDTNPAETQPSSNLPGDTTHAQNDTRAPTNPLAVHHSVGETGKPDAKKNVDDSGDGVDKSNNPVKIDGPGPRPLEVVAKEHGGDAGAKAREKKGQRSNSVDTQEDHESGTGELYVRSSGLKADGGDFDAAKPGAGKEADRLMEEEKHHSHHRDPDTSKHSSEKKHHISLPHHKKKDSGYEHGVEDGKAKETPVEDHTGNGSATHDRKIADEEVAHNWELKSTKPADLEHKEKTSLKEKIKQKLHRSSVSSN
ncbi:hypothetical protein QBC36DRAFT_219161 [Triangularia setosa]|uniref:Uncharacterized protein n=1 Tax=Triangularia setosa TaxID=2587417 RepID=A0AAN6W4H6_9PEZI|nr:hypothetical protein QBC36DRAFT_219161 [Podospora setosa]